MVNQVATKVSHRMSPSPFNAVVSHSASFWSHQRMCPSVISNHFRTFSSATSTQSYHRTCPFFSPLLQHHDDTSVSPGFQALCYLSEDPPPHRRILPPSTVSTLPPIQMLSHNQRSSPLSSSAPPLFSILLLPPPSLLTSPPSTLPPSNVMNGQQPSYVTLVRPSYNAFLPLPTMLTTLSIPPPPHSLTLPPTFRTCHRTSVSIGLAKHQP